MALALTGVYAQNNLPALAGKVIEFFTHNIQIVSKMNINGKIFGVYGMNMGKSGGKF